MRKFNHDSDKISTACGFESAKDLYAYTISALSAIEDGIPYTNLNDNEKVAVLALVALITEETSLFKSVSRNVEALYTTPEDCIAIQEFIDQVFTKEHLEIMLRKYTYLYNAE
jgi:hypothetical protein